MIVTASTHVWGAAAWLGRVSLVARPTRIWATVAVAVLVAATLWRRPRHLYARLAAGLGVSYLIAFAAWWCVLRSGVFQPSPPRSLVPWVAGALFAVVVGVVAWRGGRRPERLLQVVGGVCAIALAAAAVNAHYGYYPTVAALLGRQANHQISEAQLHRRVHALTAGRTARLAHAGVSVSVAVPPTLSRFNARNTWVYLPPAWFTNPRPALPVVFVLHGTPGSPADMLRAGMVDQSSDKFATAHQGLSPILVMPDINGSFGADTECVNTPGARAETYLVEDVRRYVLARFDADPRPQSWAIVGYSEGGTCALELGLRHPDLFRAIGDVGGEPQVSAGSTATTLRRLFGGSWMRWAAHDPASLLRTRTYQHLDVSAWFAILRDSGSPASTLRLARRAEQDGITTVVTRPNLPHTYPMFHAEFDEILPWLWARFPVGQLPGASSGPAVRGVAVAGHFVHPPRRASVSARAPRRSVERPQPR